MPVNCDENGDLILTAPDCDHDDFSVTFRLGYFPQFQFFTSNPNKYFPMKIEDAKKIHDWLSVAIPKMEKAKKRWNGDSSKILSNLKGG